MLDWIKEQLVGEGFLSGKKTIAGLLLWLLSMYYPEIDQAMLQEVGTELLTQVAIAVTAVGAICKIIKRFLPKRA